MIDGQDCINIYSKGETELGRFLSNFTKHPILTEDGKFNSIEGYWYWLGCIHENKDKLRGLSGFLAKKVGKELGSPDWLDSEDFKNKIKKAIDVKLATAPENIKTMFRENKLPYKHYYVYGGKQVNVPKADWIVEYISSRMI